MTELKDEFWVDIVENPDYAQGDKKPIFIGVPQEKNPKMRKGVKIGENWYNIAIFQAKDFETGDPIPGQMSIRLQKNKPMQQGQQRQGGYQQSSFKQNNFGNKPNYGNRRYG